jgi:hypothetical protein
MKRQRQAIVHNWKEDCVKNGLKHPTLAKHANVCLSISLKTKPFSPAKT